jgi:diaminohydroxyphosphoribosylaminopyrimidine deaminase / 5-amino-6-(5-phosphoribosylamino)uracil reductase
MDERDAMRLAIACARSVEGRTAPRPPVGAVVVRDGVVVGQGATSPPYGPHAEIHALNEAGPLARGADLYVTLEPCCVTIHTPPCTNAIIAAGIRRVIVGSLDANPLVSGRGVDQLRAAGIDVTTGIDSAETDEIVRPFATFITKGRPYVTAKWAMTLDGKIAAHTGDAYWISGPAARQWVHRLRDRVDAILVGAGTVRADDPQLTVRLTAEQRECERADRQGPLRVVLSSRGELPVHSKLFQPDLAVGTCVLVGADERGPVGAGPVPVLPLQAPAPSLHQWLRDCGVEVVTVATDGQGQLDLVSVLAILAQKGVMHLLIEGGSGVLGSAFDSQLVDHVAAFIAPKIIGGQTAPSPVGGTGLAAMIDAYQLQQVKIQPVGEDILVEGEVAYEK